MGQKIAIDVNAEEKKAIALKMVAHLKFIQVEVRGMGRLYSDSDCDPNEFQPKDFGRVLPSCILEWDCNLDGAIADWQAIADKTAIEVAHG